MQLNDTPQYQRRFFMLRSVVIIGQLLAVLAARYGLDMQLPLMPMLAIIGAYVVFNFSCWWRNQRVSSFSAGRFFVHLCVDMLVLVGLLYFVGGATNPFVSLLLLPLVIAAATLPRQLAWGMAALAVGSYSLLMFAYHDMPHMHSTHAAEFDLHVTGMWFSFLLGVSLIVFFVINQAEALRNRDRALAEARQRALRDENLVSLGTFAAGAAHELGTPLSTMAVIAKELENSCGDDNARQQAAILRQQIERCKTTLTEMSAKSQHARAGDNQPQNVDSYLQDIAERWQAMRPDSHLQFRLVADLPPPAIIPDATLAQGIINLLNNAADACPKEVSLNARWDNRQLQLEILDCGPGLPEEVINSDGRSAANSEKGLGLGLYLTRAVINRYGGELRLQNRECGGASVNIRLPIDKLQNQKL